MRCLSAVVSINCCTFIGERAGLITSDKEWRALKGSHADRLPFARFTVVYPREQLADHDNATLL